MCTRIWLTVSLWVTFAGMSLAGKGAERYVVVDSSGALLLSSNLDEPCQVASLTKVTTVLVALQWIDHSGATPDQMIEVSAEAVSGGVNPLALQVGDRLSLRSAMAAAMMASDNTSAYAIAEFIGQQWEPEASPARAVERFVEAMNRTALNHGAEFTRFVNPHGLDEGDELGVSTAADQALLAMAALEHPEFLKFCREVTREIEVTRNGTITRKSFKNTNELVGNHGIDGMKTGTTRRSGPCLIATAVLPEGDGGGRLISVLLNSDDRFGRTVDLLKNGWRARALWIEEGRIETNRRLLSIEK